MLESLKSFDGELAATVAEIVTAEGKLLGSSPTQERIRELFGTWTQVLRPNLLQADIQAKGLSQVDRLLELCARNSTKKIHKTKFTEPLKKVRRILMGTVYADVIQVPGHIAKPIAPRLIPEIPDLPSNLIPKALLGWNSKMADFLHKYPFDKNVFILVRYAGESESVIRGAMETVRNFKKGDETFVPIIAREHRITDDLYNPIACLLCCRFGIAIFDSVTVLPKINPNVAYELGMMHLLGRTCLILKDSKLKTLPADILQKLYEPYSGAAEAQAKITNWLNTLASTSTP